MPPTHPSNGAWTAARAGGLIRHDLRKRITGPHCHFVKFIFLTRVYTLFFLADTDNEEKDADYRRAVRILPDHPDELGDHLKWLRALAPSGGFASQRPQESN